MKTTSWNPATTAIRVAGSCNRPRRRKPEKKKDQGDRGNRSAFKTEPFVTATKYHLETAIILSNAIDVAGNVDSRRSTLKTGRQDETKESWKGFFVKDPGSRGIEVRWRGSYAVPLNSDRTFDWHGVSVLVICAVNCGEWKKKKKEKKVKEGEILRKRSREFTTTKSLLILWTSIFVCFFDNYPMIQWCITDTR